MQTHSDRLRQMIVASGLGPYELARRSGVQACSIQRFRDGKQSLMLDAADRLFAALASPEPESASWVPTPGDEVVVERPGWSGELAIFTGMVAPAGSTSDVAAVRSLTNPNLRLVKLGLLKPTLRGVDVAMRAVRSASAAIIESARPERLSDALRHLDTVRSFLEGLRSSRPPTTLGTERTSVTGSTTSQHEA